MASDFLLIRKMKQGNEEAFNIFVNKYYKEIMTYCTYHCKDREYAEDLTQETFFRFFQNLSIYKFQGKTRSYLYTIASNLCKDFYKKIKDIPTDERDFYNNSRFNEDLTDKILDDLTIKYALEQLPAELYEVIILYYFQDLKMNEIANILNIGLPLTKYRLRQAKIQLEKNIRKGDK